MDKIYLPKVKKSIPKILSEEDISKLLDIKLDDIYSYRNKTILELMYATGLRVSELVNLKLTDIDLDDDIIRTFGKGSKERVIPYGDYAKEYIELYINKYRHLMLKNTPCDYLFLNNHGKK